jgi:hypothetical protein
MADVVIAIDVVIALDVILDDVMLADIVTHPAINVTGVCLALVVPAELPAGFPLFFVPPAVPPLGFVAAGILQLRLHALQQGGRGPVHAGL